MTNNPTTPVCVECQGKGWIVKLEDAMGFRPARVHVSCPSCSQPKEEAKEDLYEKRCPECPSDKLDAFTPEWCKKHEETAPKEEAKGERCGRFNIGFDPAVSGEESARLAISTQDGDVTHVLAVLYGYHAEIVNSLLAEARREQWLEDAKAVDAEYRRSDRPATGEIRNAFSRALSALSKVEPKV